MASLPELEIELKIVPIWQPPPGPLPQVFQTDHDWHDLGDGILLYTVDHRPYLVRDALQHGNPNRDESCTYFRADYITRHIDVKTGWRIAFDDDVFITHNTRAVLAAGRIYPTTITYEDFKALEHQHTYEIRGYGNSKVDVGRLTGLGGGGWNIALKTAWGMHPARSLAQWMKGSSPADAGTLAVVEVNRLAHRRRAHHQPRLAGAGARSAGAAAGR